uniref:Uncharacterized protein n=1 Tax=Anguilla anguilla TaxID=7936 RepID=A0A0E9TJ63_ANGAN
MGSFTMKNAFSLIMTGGDLCYERIIYKASARSRKAPGSKH